jgi:predicted DNA-binding transcriptional regulator AlpA
VMLSISGKTLLKLRRRKKIPEPFLAEGRQVLWTRVQIECWIESSVNKESR